MSSITGVSSVTTATNPYLSGLANTIQSGFGQTIQDFQALGTAMQSGNLAGAKAAMATFLKDFPASAQGAAVQPFGSNTQANTDFQTLTNALGTGDMTSAQKAFAALQTDLKVNVAGSATSTSSTGSFSNLLSGILSAAGISF